VAQTFPYTVECAVTAVDGVQSAHVELVWDPPWTQDRMSETELAQKLGISRKSLWERRQRLGIPRKKSSGN
jgi:metal-sulfur cluster biosynthetic enzyme